MKINTVQPLIAGEEDGETVVSVVKYDTSLRTYALFALACMAFAFVLFQMSYAGTDATFSSATTMLTGWASGSLGKSLGVASVIIGVIGCVAKFDWRPCAGAIGVGLATSIGPNILSSMSTALF